MAHSTIHWHWSSLTNFYKIRSVPREEAQREHRALWLREDCRNFLPPSHNSEGIWQNNITSHRCSRLHCFSAASNKAGKAASYIERIVGGMGGVWCGDGVTDGFCLLTSRIMNDLLCLPANCRMLELIGIKADKINKTELRMSLKINEIKFNIIIQV